MNTQILNQAVEGIIECRKAQLRSHYSDPPLIISREGLHNLVENIVNAANTTPHVRQIDGFLEAFAEMKECRWCHRRVGNNNLERGVCPHCRLSIRGSFAIARHLCKAC